MYSCTLSLTSVLDGGWWVAQMVEVLCYNPEGRGFDGVIGIFNWQSFGPHYGHGVDSVCNRNEYQEYFLGGKGGRCVRLIILPPSCADCLEISWNPQGQPRPVMRLLYLFCLHLSICGLFLLCLYSSFRLRN